MLKTTSKNTFKKGETVLKYISFLSAKPLYYAKKDKIYAELAMIVGRDDVTNDEVDLFSYISWGGILSQPLRRYDLLRGEYNIIMPDWVVYPETSEEVQQIVKFANNWKIPIIPVSGATGPGHDPAYGGIILDTKKLNRIIEIDEVSHTVTVETGIYVHELESELNKLGYEMEHKPASYWCACIGGFIGDRSAGRLSTKYGKIEKMVLGMKIVLPNGEVFNTPAVDGHASGPDLNHIFIGSGGIYGIVTEATLKIYSLPEIRIFRSFLFPSLHDGFEAMRQIMQADLRPCLARLYCPIETHNRLFLMSHVPEHLHKHIREERQGWVYLCIGLDGYKKIVDLQEEMAIEIALKNKGEDLGNDVGQWFWDHLNDDYYPGIWKGKEKPARLDDFFDYDRVVSVGSILDFAVPMKNLEKVWNETKTKLKTRFGKNTVLFGHFSHWYSHSSMMYPYSFVWGLKDDVEEIRLVYEEMRDIVAGTAIKYGGTFQHHHGVGTRWGRFMPIQWGAGFDVMIQIKRVLDPNNIMNPGQMGLRGL